MGECFKELDPDGRPCLLAHSDPTGPRRTVRQMEGNRKTESVARRYPAVLEALKNEGLAHDGNIRRAFAHSYAKRDPVERFYVAMAWGFGATNVRWPAQQVVLKDPPRRNIEGIVDAVRTDGAMAGWQALFGEHRIVGLSYAFGTELLYFAGYTSECPGPRPLVLDANGRHSMTLARAFSPRAECDPRTTWPTSSLPNVGHPIPHGRRGHLKSSSPRYSRRGRELNQVVAARRKARG
jgi:hypothetical protein